MMSFSSGQFMRLPNALIGTVLSGAALFALGTTSKANEPISIWVDNAPLQLVISQLAQLGGKEFEAQGLVDGQISGRFNGTIETTLSSIAETHPVLFDLSDAGLNVIDVKEKSTATVALGGAALESDIEASLKKSNMGGNEVIFRDGEIMVSGHPAFVKRTAMAVTTQLAKAGQFPADPGLESVSVEVTKASIEPVVDQGAEALVEDLQESAEQASDTTLLTKPVRWVTDIPGFNTF